MTTYAYMRISRDDKGQSTDNQKKAIQDARFLVEDGNWYAEEGVSGTVKALDRPRFSEMMGRMITGDVCVCTMIDRLGRTASDILNTVEAFVKMGVKLHVLQFDAIDITSPMGKMIITCMAAMAEMERNMIVERTKSGLTRTKEQGTILGPPLTISPGIMRSVVELSQDGYSLQEIKDVYGIPRNTLSKNIRKWKDDLNGYEEEFDARKEQYLSKKAA